MSNPGARKNSHEAVFMNWLNKNANKIVIQVLNSGEKETEIDGVPTIEGTATEYQIKFDPEKDLAERIVDGKKEEVNGKYMKRIYNLRKQQGRPIQTEKGSKISEDKDNSR